MKKTKKKLLKLNLGIVYRKTDREIKQQTRNEIRKWTKSCPRIVCGKRM